MSTVEYRCPTCGHRLYAEPNSPIRYKCPFAGREMADGQLHPDVEVEQVEAFHGPNFQFKDVGEVNPNKTGVVTTGAITEDGRASVTPVIYIPPAVELTEEDELEHLRGMWLRLTGEPADRRYKAPRLRQEIETLEHSVGEKLKPVDDTPTRDEDYIAQIKEELKDQIRAELLAELRAERENSNV